MKGARSQTNMQHKQEVGHRPRPEIRDDLDSRKNEEFETKGDDVTHGEKQVRSENKMRKSTIIKTNKNNIEIAPTYINITSKPTK